MAKKIVLLVFGGIAVAGLIVTIVGFALGGLPLSVRVADGQLTYYNAHVSNTYDAPSWLPGRLGQGSSEYPERSSNLETVIPDGSVEKVYIDITTARVIVLPGDEASLRVDGPLPYKQSFENGTWTISTPEEYNISFFNFSWGGSGIWGNDAERTVFTVTLPAALTSADIEIGAGELELSGFSFGKLDCTVGMGSAKIWDVSANEASLDAGMGKIDASGFTCNDMDLTVGMGTITFSGEVADEMDANCSMGSIRATLPRPATYGWSVDVGLGSISIDGNRSSGLDSESSGGDENTKPYFDLECGMGSIDVIFK